MPGFLSPSASSRDMPRRTLPIPTCGTISTRKTLRWSNDTAQQPGPLGELEIQKADIRAKSGVAPGAALFGLAPLGERGTVPAVFRVRDEAEHSIGGDGHAGHPPDQPPPGTRARPSRTGS